MVFVDFFSNSILSSKKYYYKPGFYMTQKCVVVFVQSPFIVGLAVEAPSYRKPATSSLAHLYQSGRILGKKKAFVFYFPNKTHHA